MKIEVKRVTEHGVITNEGELFEHEGFQFCLLYDIAYDIWFGIELSTGGSVTSLLDGNIPIKRAIRQMKKNIQIRTKQQIEEAINRYIAEYKGLYKNFKLKFPVNEPVKHVT